MHTLAAHPKIAQQADHGSSAILKRSRFEPGREMHAIRHLQQAIGNQAMQRLFQDMVASAEADSGTEAAGSTEDLSPTPGQAKLTINVPGDQYEREADQVADQVMGARSPAGGTAPPSVDAAVPRHRGPETVMRQAAPMND